jgi:hypothetical protein
MRCPGTRRRRATWSTVVGLWLALLASLGAVTGVAAVARAAPPPASVPADYVTEQDGSTHWTFPLAARAEVDDLRSLTHETWARFGRELGVYLAPELDIRVAVNAHDMRRLAPAGRPPPAYATGVAYPADGLILVSLTEPQSFLRPALSRVMVHELAHVALHRAVLGKDVPRWLSEGYAIDRAGERSLARIRTLWDGALQGRLLSVRELSREFPEQPREVDLAYAQAADLTAFLLDRDEHGARFRALLDRVRKGASFEHAVLGAYGADMATLEQQWRAAIASRFGRWPTLLGGLTVVWALAAVLLVAAYVRVRRRHQRTLQRWATEEAALDAPRPAAPSAIPPPPPPQPPFSRTPADDVLDAWGDQQRREAGVPTVVHDGRSYTLH